MRTSVNVLLTPVFGYQLGFPAVGKEPKVQTFAAQRAVETLDEGVLPGAARCNLHSVAAAVAQPILKGIGDALRAVVATQMVGSAPQQEEPLQELNDLARGDGAGDVDGQTFAGGILSLIHLSGPTGPD